MTSTERLKITARKTKNLFVRLYYSSATGCFPSAAIFLYHRIASVSEDPRLLSVSPENFREQLIFLKQRWDLITLSELTEKLKSGDLQKGQAAVTFDDGYADNLSTALPILEELNVPVTIFVTAGMIGSKEPFPWDTEVPQSDRGTALTREELTRLAAHPLIEIGAHTMTHPRLSKLPVGGQKDEIEESKKALEGLTGKKISLFAYPFGGKSAFTDTTTDLVRNAGFTAACSTLPTRVFPWSDPFKIPRIVVRNWGKSEIPGRLGGI